MKKIAWNSLPQWAKNEIEKAEASGTTQISRDEGSLSVMFGLARFNGVTVAKEGEVIDPSDLEEESINLSELPWWAKKHINNCKIGSTVQTTVNGDSLQIVSDGTITYNGKKVLR